MKSIKLIIGIIVAVIILSSCSQSTCPTYSYNTKPHAGSNTCASTSTSYKGFTN